MGAVRVTLLLRRDRRGDGASSGAASEHHGAPSRVRDGSRIKRGQRNQNGLREAFDGRLVGFAHVDENDTPFPQALGDFLWRQIAHLRMLVGHLALPRARTDLNYVLPAQRGRAYTVTCVPTSTTRSVGIWK